MATDRFVRTLPTMTTYLPPITVTVDPVPGTIRREARPGRLASRLRNLRTTLDRSDAKLDLVSHVGSLARCTKSDLIALSSAADLIEVGEGTTLARGRELTHWWWMPIDGWLLLSGQGKQAVTIPSGWSWMAPNRRMPPGARLTALRGGRMLTASLPVLLGTLDDHPKLAEAVSATLVGDSRGI